MSVSYHDTARASRRLTGFLLFLIGLSLTVGLYYVKTRAMTAKSEVRSLERQIAEEEAAIRVLQAEIAYLENPERLARLSAEQLGLQPTDPEAVITLAAISAIPFREESHDQPVEEVADE